MKKNIFTLIIAIFVFGACSQAWAENKNWTGEGDGSDWFDNDNWLPSGKPTASDDVKVDMKDANVDIGQAYSAKSLTLGGKKASDINVSNFVNATLAPSDKANNAMLIRRGGKISLKGSAGKITLKGSYKDSEEIIPDEPSFMLYVK